MKHLFLILLSIILVSGCSMSWFRRGPETASSNDKYLPGARYYESNYTGVGFDDHPAMIKKRLDHMKKLKKGAYYHTNHGGLWVYNTYTHEYEPWTKDMVERGRRNKTVVYSELEHFTNALIHSRTIQTIHEHLMP